MSTQVPPKKNAAYITYVGLTSQADTKIFQANPTLAAGDVKVAVDDAAPANTTTLPVVDADFTKRVKVSLSASEMDGDNITVIFSDASGDEWCDLMINIPTSARYVDDLAYPTTSGRSIDVSATGATGIDWGNVENPSSSVNLSATTTNLCNTITTYTGNTKQTADHTADISAIKAKTDDLTFTAANQVDCQVISMATDSMTADAAATDFIGAAEIAAGASQKIADLIAADWVAGDASPIAIATAVRTELATELARIDALISSRHPVNTAVDVNMSQATPGASTMGAQLDAAGGGGGGGSATLANQVAILAAVSSSVIVAQAPRPRPGALYLTAGDDYDGTVNAKPRWTVDYGFDISAATASLSITHARSGRTVIDAISATPTLISGTEYAIDMTILAAQTARLEVGQGQSYVLTLTVAGMVDTVDMGTVYAD